MTAPVVQSAPAAGSKLRAVFLAQLAANANFSIDGPAAALHNTTVQAIPNTTPTALLFDTESLDDDPSGAGGHSTSVNTSRFTAVYAGWYRVTGKYSYTISATGFRGVSIAVNGVSQNQTLAFGATPSGTLTQQVQTTGIVFLAVGSYVEIFAQQTSGGNLNTDTANLSYPAMTVQWVRLA